MPTENIVQKFSHSPYNKNNPIRKIDSIDYVYDYTKGDNITGSYCGPACIAMLTGVPFEEIIELMKDMGRVSKQVLKKVLDYYGVQYAPKSTRITKNETLQPHNHLPDICILRMIIANENGEFIFKGDAGHWSLYFKGKFYDPDWGVCDKCPPQVKVFQVWEIYQ